MLNKININPGVQKFIVYVVLTVVTLSVFWQVNHYGFVNLDDDVYVTGNFRIQSGLTLDSIRWAFSTTYAEFWHPLTWISLMFDNQLYGLNAGGYHLTNVILHILSALLLFWLFNRMTGSIWRSAFIAAFFALHPLRVESVAWIAERKDVLSAFFWMLTLCLYVYYTERPVIKRYLLVLFSFACALMSKPMAVTLPVIMILLDYWPLGRFQSQKSNVILWQLKEKTPFFILSLVFSIITLYAQHNPSLKHFPLENRFANSLFAFVIYLKKIFWPYDLAIFYPFFGQLPLLQVIGYALLIIIISALIIAAVKRLPYLFVGWLWYAVTILPVIGIINAGNNSMADRYVYIPFVGIAIMLTWGVPLLFQREEIRKKILFPAGITAIAILAVLTWQQCGYWKNSMVLCNRSLQVTKYNPFAHNGRGIAYAELGQDQRAIEDFNESIRMKPDFADAYYNRGLVYIKLGQYQPAIEDFNEAIKLNDFADAYYNRGIACIKLGQYQSAVENFRKVIRMKPDSAIAYYNRGIAYARLRLYQKAIEDFNEYIRIKPDDAIAYNSRGIAYGNLGNTELGCRDALKACELGDCKLLKMAKAKKYCN